MVTAEIEGPGLMKEREGGNKEWRDEEKKIIRDHYLSMPSGSLAKYCGNVKE
ncbi:hypothetical protein KSD_67530 [Ktedonobacter sp. SOSP1-85]|uniref:hypothetical protein n=1 Tax=Ktedonobacter sp. SOSP1-85 TaxID=2778367 RepID=UPI00191567D3|nr:hypothetical protein [Ktedonobacter sp. SOSP1-85]GHO78982.1 hypothetical protein KSD_67530 [Ktedonobacter sp. SOSP1-85]